MAKTTTVLCPSCGFKNTSSNTRCISCGAKMQQLAAASPEPKVGDSARYQQDGFSIMWMFIALAVLAILTAAVVIGLPMVIRQLDFEGIYGMYICVPVWFVGGMLVGLISPGRTFIEPVVASLIVAIPTVFYLVQSQTVRTMPTFMYVIIGCAGIMFTLVGAYLGERIQMGPSPNSSD